MRETKKQIMEGVSCVHSKFVAKNTVRYVREDGTVVIRLHQTDILEISPAGEIVFNSGGWKTSTTKSRMNEFQHEITIIQRSGLWYIDAYVGSCSKENLVPFFDGVRVHEGNVVERKKSAHIHEKALLKQINEKTKN